MHDSVLCPSTHSEPDVRALQAAFLRVLPRIEKHAHIQFRDVRCPGHREDAVAEVVGISWKWFVDLTQRGKDPTSFISTIANFAARAVKSGRRLCGMEKAKEVMSPLAQQRQGFVVGTLPEFSTLNGNPLEEALHDNTRPSPDEQAAFRIDFPAWLTTLSDRDRRIVHCLAQGERTFDAARMFGISPGRIAQLRRRFHDDWCRFHGELPETASSQPAPA